LRIRSTSRVAQEDRKQGFTLLEILIAIFLLAVVMAIVLGPFTGIIANSRDMERKVDLYQTARSLMDILSADIRGIYEPQTKGEDLPFKASLENVDLSTPMPRLDFVTTHSLAIGPQKNPFLTEAGYRLRKDPKGELYTLWRRTQSPPLEPLDEGGREIPICRIVESFQLKFMYGEEWTTELTDQIPRAIIIDFTLNLDGERETFVTMVRPMVTAERPGKETPGPETTTGGTNALEKQPAPQKSAQ
jgi:prepilin-type N-terminal cleavage/methylation domain-containing protein